MRTLIQNLAIASLCISSSSALHSGASNSTSVAYGQTAGEGKTRVPPAVHVPPPHPTAAPNNTHASPNSTHALLPTDLSKTSHDNAPTHANLTAGPTDSPATSAGYSSTIRNQQSDVPQQTSAPAFGNGADNASLQIWQIAFAALAAFYWA